MKGKHSIRSIVRLSLTAAFGAMPGVAFAQAPAPEDAQLLSVRVESPRDREALFDLEIANPELEIWTDDRGAPSLEVRVSGGGRAAIERLGLAYAVVIEDLDCLYDDYFNRTTTGDFFDDYATYEEHAAFLHELAARFPELATVVDLGPSVEGRPQWMIRITGQGTEKPGVFYHAAQHGSEIMGPCVLAYLARHLLENYESDGEVRALVDGAEWFLVPISNPDGYVQRRRENAHHADLNRDWGGPGAGEEPFSQPETAHLRDMMLEHGNIAVHNDLHSYGKMIMWAWGHTPDNCADHWTYVELGDHLADVLNDYRGTRYDKRGSIYDTIYPVSGSAVNYCYGEHSITSLTFEIGVAFFMPPEEILPTCLEFLPTLEALGSIVIDCNENRIPDWSELASNPALDCNANLRLDECESLLDCNANTVLDFCELTDGKVGDCNGNAIPDECDIEGKTSFDHNRNSLPDECEPCESARILPPEDTPYAGDFGESVAFAEDTFLVSARSCYFDPEHQGSVVVFNLADNSVRQILTLPNPNEDDCFGAPLDVDGDTLAVGSTCHDAQGEPIGAVEVYTWTKKGWDWRYRALSRGANPTADGFGTSLEVNGSWLIVGAPSDSQGHGSEGAVHVFAARNSEWEFVQTLRAPPEYAGAYFGFDVAMDENCLWITAYGWHFAHVYELENGKWLHKQAIDHGGMYCEVSVSGKSAAVGVNNQGVFLFRLLNNSWELTKQLSGAGGRYLKPWLLTEQHMLVAEPAAEGENVGSGALFAYNEGSHGWRRAARLDPPHPGNRHDRYGRSIDVKGESLLVGGEGFAVHWKGIGAGCAAVQLEAKCRQRGQGTGRRSLIQVYHADPNHWVTLRLDGDPSTDTPVTLDCYGWGRAVLRRVSTGPHVIEIVACGALTSFECP
ncbi:MAG: hypothetical protein IT449_06640 [Phycisphaerales bacterium]|nr:hypothetical protein [Phycisphaerales bacterium]